MKNKQIFIGFHKLSVNFCAPFAKPGADSINSMMADFRLDTDISSLFPYINAVAEKAELHENPGLLRFIFKGSNCVLYPDYCLISPVKDRNHAREYALDLVQFLNDIAGRLDEIEPKYKLFRKVSVLDLLKLLPQSNCRKCGFATCMAFAATLSQQQTIPSRCPYMGYPVQETVSYPVYDQDGNLKSTLTFELDTAHNRTELEEQKKYITQLKDKLSSLSESQKEESQKANVLLPSPLTDREIEVLRLMANGATNTEISKLLKISSHTVKSHVINIFNKLSVNNRTQAAVWAARHKFI